MRSKNFVLNVFSGLVLQIIMIVYGLLLPKIIISNYGSDVNGLIISITQFLGYITLLESGFGPVIKATLYKPISKKNKDEIQEILGASERIFRRISYIFILYIIILSFIFPFFIAEEFDIIFTISLILIISIGTFAEYYFGITYRLFLQSSQKNYVVSIIQIVTYIISIIFILFVSKVDISVHILKLIIGIIFLARPLIQNLYVKKYYNLKINHNSHYKLKQQWDALAQHIAAVVFGNTDVAVLSIFTKMAEVSVYSVYSLVATALKSFAGVMLNGIDSILGDMIAKQEYSNLNEKFSLFEVLYYGITTILFCCGLHLIIPFVKLYTNNISDANYVRYLFGYLIVIGQFIWAVRQPYNELVKAAGHFKETKRGAYVEAISNIVISVILVFKFGIIGVAIGTIVALLLRMIDFIIYVNKNILNRSNTESIKKIGVVIIISVTVSCIISLLNIEYNCSIIGFVIYGLYVFFVTTIICLFVSILAYKKELLKLNKFIKDMIKI